MENFEYSLYIAFKAGNLNKEVLGMKGVLLMIKGVNKKVIEITRPDSVYFERAVLYLRPEVSEVPLHAAQAETEGYFTAVPVGRFRSAIRNFLLFLTGAVTSAGICMLVMWLIK